MRVIPGDSVVTIASPHRVVLSAHVVAVATEEVDAVAASADVVAVRSLEDVAVPGHTDFDVIRVSDRSSAELNIWKGRSTANNPCSGGPNATAAKKPIRHDRPISAPSCYGSVSKPTGLGVGATFIIYCGRDRIITMSALFPRRNMRPLDFRLRTYGITAVLGLTTLGGVPQCAPAPALTRAPAPAVAPVSDVQNAVLKSVNHHRASAGRAPVVVDGRLTAAAQSHSDDLARRETMTHTGTGGTDGGQRIRKAGYRWSTWGENVAAGQSTPTAVMSAWFASPGHRANILHGSVDHIGVAATTGSDGVVYWTMVVAAGS